MKLKQFQPIVGDPIKRTEDRQITLEASLWRFQSVIVVIEEGRITTYPTASVIWWE